MVHRVFVSARRTPTRGISSEVRAETFYGTAIPACALFIGVLFGHQPYLETASRSMANTIVDVAALEATIDIKHLPRQDLSSEVYQ